MGGDRLERFGAAGTARRRPRPRQSHHTDSQLHQDRHVRRRPRPAADSTAGTGRRGRQGLAGDETGQAAADAAMDGGIERRPARTAAATVVGLAGRSCLQGVFVDGRIHRPAAGEVNAVDAMALVGRLRDTFDGQRTRPLAWRRVQLLALRRLLVEREAELADALQQDLGKHPTESHTTELGFTRNEIDFTLKHLAKWSRGAKVRVPLTLQPASALVAPQPLGVVLVLSPWNYPVQLLLAPLCGALAAGNC